MQQRTSACINKQVKQNTDICTVICNCDVFLGAASKPPPNVTYCISRIRLFSKMILRLSLLTVTSSNQMRKVLLFVCSKMDNETNLSPKLPVADRIWEIWGRKLCWWCLNSGFPLSTFLLGFADSYWFVFTSTSSYEALSLCLISAICSHDSVGMFKSLREALRVSLYRFFWPYGSVFALVVLHRGFSSANVH